MIFIPWWTLLLGVACFIAGHMVSTSHHVKAMRRLARLDDRTILSLVRMWGPKGIYSNWSRWP